MRGVCQPREGVFSFSGRYREIAGNKKAGLWPVLLLNMLLILKYFIFACRIDPHFDPH